MNELHDLAIDEHGNALHVGDAVRVVDVKANDDRKHIARTGIVHAWPEWGTSGVKFDDGGRVGWDDGFMFERINP